MHHKNEACGRTHQALAHFSVPASLTESEKRELNAGYRNAPESPIKETPAKHDRRMTVDASTQDLSIPPRSVARRNERGPHASTRHHTGIHDDGVIARSVGRQHAYAGSGEHDAELSWRAFAEGFHDLTRVLDGGCDE
jgi:hypothetical protein